jgi:hypothetical protein
MYEVKYGVRCWLLTSGGHYSATHTDAAHSFNESLTERETRAHVKTLQDAGLDVGEAPVLAFSMRKEPEYWMVAVVRQKDVQISD